MIITCTTYTSPVGALTIAIHDERLVAVTFPGDWEPKRTAIATHFREAHFEHQERLIRWTAPFDAYFAGQAAAFDDVPVDPVGTTFQRAVWAALRRVPDGATASYADIARAIGRPTACRAVGAANGANPIVLVVPCHRVIGTGGALTGYGGGLDRKRWLLQHERSSRTKNAMPASAKAF